MNPSQQKAAMSSSTMETLKLCQNLGLSISIIESDSATASPVNVQNRGYAASDNSVTPSMSIQVPKGSKTVQNMPRNEAKAPVSQSRTVNPNHGHFNRVISGNKQEQEGNSTMKSPDSLNAPNKSSQSNLHKHLTLNQPENKNIINRLSKNVPFTTEHKSMTVYRASLSTTSRQADTKVSSVSKQLLQSTLKMETKPVASSNISVSAENMSPITHSRLVEGPPQESKTPANPNHRNFQIFDQSRASTPKPENISSPVAVVSPVQKRASGNRKMSSSLPAPAKKKCINPNQSEMITKTFDPNSLQAPHNKDDRQVMDQAKLFTMPGPSPVPSKKKGINAAQSEMANKSYDQNNTQSAQTKSDRPTTEKPKLFDFSNLSPGLTITPITSAGAAKSSAPVSASITCKVLNEPSPPSKDKLIVCPNCKNPSQSITKCDTCKQNIGVNTHLSQQAKTMENAQKAVAKHKTLQQSLPIVVKNFTLAKEIIYPNMVQFRDGMQTEHLHFKQSVQSKMVIMGSPRFLGPSQVKSKPKNRRRSVEPVCLTISSDDEEPMGGSLSAFPEESSSLSYHQESDSSKSPNSSPGGLISQDMLESDDQTFPGVTHMHRNPEFAEGGAMDFEDEEELDEFEMGEEMDEEEDLEEEEEELEEEEEDEVPPDEDEEEEEEMRMEMVGDPRSALGNPICCRSIRIGSFKIHPRKDEQYLPIYLNNESFFFKVPTVDDPMKVVSIQLRSSDIVDTIVHFGKALPIMFIFTTPSCAENLRNLLHMSKNDSLYFDPTSSDEKLKRITFLIDSCNENHRKFLHTHFPGEAKLKEIDQKSANEILVKSTPQHNQLIRCQPDVRYQAGNQPQMMMPTSIQQNQLIRCQPDVRYQTDSQLQMVMPIPMQQNQKENFQQGGIYQSAGLVDNQLQVTLPSSIQQQVLIKPMPPVPVTKILTYPPPPQTGGIPITSEDMACLEEGEFLNDAIIDFYLKYVFYEKLSEQSRERTHIFSSYFYPRLTQKPLRSKPGDEEPNVVQSKRHGQVKTWTRHVDIFSKDYIIIPINQNVHWFLAIICFPGRVPEASSLPPKPEEKPTNKSVDNVTSTDDSDAANKPISVAKVQSCPDEDNNQNQDENSNSPHNPFTFELEEPPDPEDPNPAVPDSSTHPRRREVPCICIFDSLCGPNRWRIAATLREYLDVEWKIKKGTKRVFDRNTMQGFVLQCPQQTNFSDCGLYVLQYVESFFENPLSSFGSPMPDLSSWFAEENVAKKRGELKNLILHLQKRQASNQPTPIVTSPR